MYCKYNNKTCSTILFLIYFSFFSLKIVFYLDYLHCAGNDKTKSNKLTNIFIAKVNFGFQRNIFLK